MTERTILEWQDYNEVWGESGRWSYNTFVSGEGFREKWIVLSLYSKKKIYGEPMTSLNYTETDERGSESAEIARRKTIIEVKQLAQRIQDQMDGVAPDETTAWLERRIDEIEMKVTSRSSIDETRRMIDKSLTRLTEELKSP